MAVIDPGVGSERRAILVEAAGQYFVGPDNGLFSMVMAREKHKARVITNDRYFHWPVSRTFQGRDVFAPVGAHLAAGVPAASMGKISAAAMLADLERPQVLHIDHFGNIVTNLPADDLQDKAGFARDRRHKDFRRRRLLRGNGAGPVVPNRRQLGIH